MNFRILAKYDKKVDETIIRNNLKNIANNSNKKIPRFKTSSTEKNADITKLLEKIDEKVKYIISASDFEKKGLSVIGLKQYFQVYNNINEAIKHLTTDNDDFKASINETQEDLQIMVNDLESSLQNEQLEFKKDASYMTALYKAHNNTHINILNLLKNLSPECYYALKSINDILAANMQIFMGNLNHLVDYIREIKHSEHKIKKEAVKSTRELAQKLELVIEENEKLKKQSDKLLPQVEFDDSYKENPAHFLQESPKNRIKDVFANNNNIKVQGQSSLQMSHDKNNMKSHSRPSSRQHPTEEIYIPLPDLKTTIDDVIEAKRKYDDLCDKLKLRFEIVKTFMKIYLNDKYSTSRAVKEFSDKFERSIDKYARIDINIMIFKNVYDNIIDEEFFNIKDDIKGRLKCYLEVSLLGYYNRI